MNSIQQRQLEDLSAALAAYGWVIRLVLDPNQAPHGPHVVVSASCFYPYEYLVQPSPGHELRIWVRNRGELRPIGHAFDVAEVHAVYGSDIRASRESCPWPVPA